MSLNYKPIKYKSVEVFVRDELKPIVDAEIRKLQMIDVNLYDIPACQNLHEIIAKLAKIQSSGSGNVTSYELQTLTFHLIDLSKSLRDFFLSKYIPHHWKPIAIRGLMHSLLQFWNEPFAESVRNILVAHRKEMQPLQVEAFEYMDSPTSGAKLSTYIYNHKAYIWNAPQHVLLKNEMFHYPYFEDVILDYFQKRQVQVTTIALADETLTKHNVARFDKILLPQIILKANTNKYLEEEIKKELIQVSTRRIGEPNDVSKWQDDSLNNEQKGQLLKARQILRTWQIIRVIDNVFNKASATSYPDRAIFWRKYAQYLLSMNDETQPFLRVLSTESLYNVLNIDERKLFYRRLIQGPENTAVLMRFGDYTFVELLDGGCMYVYRDNHAQPAYKNPYAYVWTNSVQDIRDLKFPNVTLITKDDVYDRLNSLPDSIKIAHRGEWQSYFRHLLVTKKIII